MADPDPLSTLASPPPSSNLVSSTMTTTTTTRDRPYSISAVALIFLVPALGGFLFGYEIGATSYAIVQLTMMDGSNGASFSLGGRPALTGLVVSAPSAGALLGTTLVFGIAERIGRRMELRIGGLLYIVGALLEFVTTYITASRMALVVLLMARLVYGTGIGFAMHGAPTYLGEMCPPNIRGALVSSKEVAIVLGILSGYAIGYAFLHTYRGWAYTYLMTIFFSVAMVLLSYKIPYSARWLVSRDRDEEALLALEFVWESEERARQELDSMIQARDSSKERTQVDTYQQQEQAVAITPMNNDSNDDVRGLFHPSCRAALTAGVGLVALQQITGQPSVLSYATPILVSAGLSSFSSVLVALFKVLATSLAVIFVEKSGRRKLLMIGCTLMFVALVILTVTFHGNGNGSGTSSSSNDKGGGIDMRSVFTLVAMFVYIGGYQVGFGPISWLIISEVFPQSVRGQAVALAVQTNFLLNAVVQFGVPVLEAKLGLSFTFGMFGLLTAYSIYFVNTKVPETKGLTLEEIEDKFASMTRAGGIVPDHGSSTSMEEERVQLISREHQL